jgi:recombination protein RecA
VAAAQEIEALLAQLGPSKLRVARATETPRPLLLDWPELAATLPDGGLPRGVVELSSPGALGGATSVALAAVCAGQARGEHAWCAWLDPEASLHAPGVVAAGVDLGRMLVVRPPRAHLARTAVKVVAAGAFEVVVVDMDPVPHALVRDPDTARGATSLRARNAETFVRKLALAAEPSGATVLLLTDGERPRGTPWPVALRLELSRPDMRSMAVRVAKDKRGRIGVTKTVPFLPVTRNAGLRA